MANLTVNEVRILGNITRDPVARTMPGAVPRCVLTISVATTEEYVDHVSGEKKEISEFHRVVLYDPLASALRDRLQKGNQVYVEGRNQTRKWTDRSTQQDRYVTEVICTKIVKTSASVDSGEGPKAKTPVELPANPGAAAVALAKAGEARSRACADDDDVAPF